MSSIKIPVATYRLQFSPHFGFKEAMEIVRYLHELGISSIYASPIFKARKGSLHGYDVVDQNKLNAELGSQEDFERLIGEVKSKKMNWIQDIVPNHMAYDSQNKMLMDVLENGSSSEYFYFFDIEWNHPYESLRGKLLAPFLGKLYGDALESGEIVLKYEEDGFTVNYYDIRLPLKIESYVNILTYRLNILKNRLGDENPDFINLLGILYSLKNLPVLGANSGERYDQIRFIKKILWELYTRNAEIKRFLDENVRIFNGEKGKPASFNMLHDLLSEQNFRLCFWKVATEEINYRRFFNINELISLRMEDESVFNYTHSLVLRLVKQGVFSGLRIDHIDGLYDPTGYLNRLRKKAESAYIVVEKILDLKEELPCFWPVQGTTGYDFLNYVNGLFCMTVNERAFSRIYSGFTGLKTPYWDLVADKKRLIIGKHMAGDIDNLAHLMKRISSRHRYGSDITLYGLRRALVEVMALFPVYRTYVCHDLFGERDRLYIKEAVERAKRTNPGLVNELEFIEQFLLLRFGEYVSEEERKECIDFIMRFQQFTGPLMAKGFEDTTLYVYNRLISLNEVGGSPDKFGISLEEFHEFNQRRLKDWPHSLNATSTHDTKRGEDIRARINVISEIPGEWRERIRRWNKLNSRKKRSIGGKNVPDLNDEYFLYQTLIGAFPFKDEEYSEFVERIKNYMIKAIREAKVHTAWLKPDNEYEEAFLSFIQEILDPGENNRFLKDFIPFQKRIAHYGIFNSLSQTLIKLTSPGVPDFYQGTELWDLNLVDPDNRRPVDFNIRQRFLSEIKVREKENLGGLIEELVETREDGRIKLFLIYRVLRLRNAKRSLFENGDYLPLEITGRYKDNIITFARRRKEDWAIVVAPRFLTSVIKENEYPLGRDVWLDTSICVPEEAPLLWKDVFSDMTVEFKGRVLVGDILRFFPVGLIVGKKTK